MSEDKTKLDQIAQLGDEEYIQARTLVGDAWRQFRRHKLAMLASAILIFIILAVTFGPYLWTIEPDYIEITEKYSSPTAAHPLGTDNIGRDTLARILSGGRVSLAIGLSAMAIAMTIGTLIGLLSGYFSSLDSPLMRLTDLFLSLPTLPLLLVLTMLFREPIRAFIGPEAGVFILTVFIIGSLGWMGTARLVRGEVLSIKETEFIIAAKSVGATNMRIVMRHILPNVLSPVIVAATFSIASAIITESALSFLGMGFPPDFPTWGRLLFENQGFIRRNPELVFWPGMMISLTVLCVNFIGDGLRDALDPRLRK